MKPLLNFHWSLQRFRSAGRVRSWFDSEGLKFFFSSEIISIHRLLIQRLFLKNRFKCDLKSRKWGQTVPYSDVSWCRLRPCSRPAMFTIESLCKWQLPKFLKLFTNGIIFVIKSNNLYLIWKEGLLNIKDEIDNARNIEALCPPGSYSSPISLILSPK